MCGIAGVYRYRGIGDDVTPVRNMLERLTRRGPDDQGIVVEQPAVLGNRRLAILDLSANAHQPMHSADRRYWITFNGELYNYDDVRRELGLSAHDLRSRSDTEILLHAWAKWGEDALPRFVGQWAFALFDTHERRMWLARDRFGEKPLFYHDGREIFAFASTVEALLQHPQVPRDLDSFALAEYVTLRYVVSPRTVLRGVRKLEPGRLLTIGPDGRRERSWWTAQYCSTGTRARRRGELVAEFDSLLNQATERCMVSDVPVALLLSNGIDSHSIRASLAKTGHAVPAYTFYSREHRDSPTAPDSSGHSTIAVEASRADRVAHIVPAFSSLTEPTGDGAAVSTWMLIRAVRSTATVFLCGHGGDEVLGGYRLSQDRFRLAVLRRLAGLPLQWVHSPLDRFLYGDEPVADRRTRLRDCAAPFAPAAARYLIHRPLPYGDVVELFGGPPPERYLRTVDALYDACPASSSDLDRMQDVLLPTFLSANILTFADSVAMDSSAELRMPYLDRDLVDFVFRLAPKYRAGRWPGRTNTKRILRWWAKNAVPADVLARRKHSFPSGVMADLVKDHEAELKSRVLDVAVVRQALPGVESWLSRPAASYRGPWDGTYWALLALAIWCNHLGVRPDSAFESRR